MCYIYIFYLYIIIVSINKRKTKNYFLNFKSTLKIFIGGIYNQIKTNKNLNDPDVQAARLGITDNSQLQTSYNTWQALYANTLVSSSSTRKKRDCNILFILLNDFIPMSNHLY